MSECHQFTNGRTKYGKTPLEALTNPCNTSIRQVNIWSTYVFSDKGTQGKCNMVRGDSIPVLSFLFFPYLLAIFGNTINSHPYLRLIHWNIHFRNWIYYDIKARETILYVGGRGRGRWKRGGTASTGKIEYSPVNENIVVVVSAPITNLSEGESRHQRMCTHEKTWRIKLWPANKRASKHTRKHTHVHIHVRREI